MTAPLSRITAYTTQLEDGVLIDICGIATDLIIVAKMNRDSWESFEVNMRKIWDDTKVEIKDN